MLFKNFLIILLQFSKKNETTHSFIQKLAYSTTFRRILSGSFWNALLNLWSKGISFIGTVIIIRIIGREAFGEFGMLNTTIAMFGMFTTFSVSQTATKFIAEYRESDKEKTGRIIGLSFMFSSGLGLLLFLGVFIFADLLAVTSLNAPHLAGSLKLMALGLLFGALNGAQNGIISGFESFKSNTVFNVFLSLVLVAIKIVLTYSYGFTGAVIGMVVEPVITYCTTYFLTKNILNANSIHIRFKGAVNESGILLSYGLPSLFAGLIIFPTNWYVMTLLAKSEGGYYDLGAYNVANQWFNLLIFIPYILVSTFLPVFSNLLSDGKQQQVNRIIKNAVFIILVIFIPLTLFFLFFGDTIARLIYGKSFIGTGYLIAVAVFTMIPQGLSIVFGNLVGALSKMWFSFWVNLVWCIVLLIAVHFWLPYGPVGLLYAKLLAFSSSFMIMLLFYKNWRIKSKFPYSDIKN